jgi:hypothetical protein
MMVKSYSEDGSFTHDGVEYNLHIALSSACDIPSVKVDDIKWIMEYDKPQNMKRVKNADITTPILVAFSKNGKLTVVDGLHRLAKAILNDVDELPARMVKILDKINK